MCPSVTSWTAAAHGTAGQSTDTFGPTGPWLVTADEVLPDLRPKDVWMSTARFQNGSTSTMV
jgi:2-keto-4-pentenoate hydratase/2-oxohepta-3-ene-1,7-dioic acid hydratase in catechol pathway